ncbi:MAG: hypothetical protein HY006_04390 [Candidatus Sungbacteria bacterium]|nr:hypothetical protein [Candidatus Sungbacteria bacterium]
MIPQSIEKVKNLCKEHSNDLFVALIIFLVGLAGFGLGRLSYLLPEHQDISIEDPSADRETTSYNSDQEPRNSATSTGVQGKYIGSRSGTAYHYPWCPGAVKIKESNKVWFATVQEAQERGYKPAGNCPGLPASSE